eukprot:7487451-Karenia_brevis.AAC.1
MHALALGECVRAWFIVLDIPRKASIEYDVAGVFGQIMAEMHVPPFGFEEFLCSAEELEAKTFSAIGPCST